MNGEIPKALLFDLLFLFFCQRQVVYIGPGFVFDARIGYENPNGASYARKRKHDNPSQNRTFRSLTSTRNRGFGPSL